MAVAVLAIVGGCATVYAWAVAAPAGASPDEDFHLTSAWCPMPLEKSCAVTYTSTGVPQVSVPDKVIDASHCYAFQPEQSAACEGSLTDDNVWTSRVNDGMYPGGFYNVMHLFIGQNVFKSVVLMRLVNGGLAIGLMAVVAFLLPRTGRRLMAYATLAVVVPDMIYFVCSINPSGWAMTGLAVAWFAMYAAFHAESRWRGIVSGVIALAGAAMGATARSDAGAYLAVAAVGATILFFPQIRRQWWKIVVPCFVMAIGLVGFFSGNQTDILSTDLEPVYPNGQLQFLMNNLFQVPSLLIGYSGGSMGLNWVDTGMPAIVWIPVLLVSLGLVFWGLRRNDWRKVLTLAGVTLVFIGLPLYVLQRGAYPVGQMVQPRYLMPLVPIIVAVALYRPGRGGASRLSRTQSVLAYLALVGAQAVALHTQIRRFVTGVDVTTFNLNYQAEWWHAGPSPMMTWILGSVGFAVVALVLFVVSRGPNNQDVSVEPRQQAVIADHEIPDPLPVSVAVHAIAEADE